MDHLPKPANPEVQVARKLFDSLNERDDVDNSEEEPRNADGKVHDPEFDVNDRSQTIQIEQPLL